MNNKVPVVKRVEQYLRDRKNSAVSLYEISSSLDEPNRRVSFALSSLLKKDPPKIRRVEPRVYQWISKDPEKKGYQTGDKIEGSVINSKRDGILFFLESEDPSLNGEVYLARKVLLRVDPGVNISYSIG